ncbi:MAG: deoxyribonuclease IV [Actinobacteria bacterium]|nr:deoxyribonuclease IV [Actinomycetota bacterium]
MLIGAHVSNRDPLTAAADRKADIVQFFLSNPKGWKLPKTRHDVDELKASGMDVYVHAPYLINVVSTNPRVRHPSRKLIQETCSSAANIGAKAVIVHAGYLEEDEDPETGFDRWRKALEPLETEIPLYIENTAGGVNAMARGFDVLARLWEAIADMDVPLGFCLDTCHTHAAGEDLATAVERLEDAVGGIDLVHLNDSKDAFGSGRDRHTNIGRGQIDPDLLVQVVRDAGAPVIVETPEDDDVGQADDIAWLRDRL